MGGVASLAVILISAMAFRFALSYLAQYPAEKVGPSSFACDETIRNSKFDSRLRPLSVPVPETEQPVLDLLDEQIFTLHLAFINTATSCEAVSIVEMIESVTHALPDVLCNATNGTVTIRAALPQHKITVQAILNDIQLVGGVRLGLSGPGQETELHTLHELNFNRALFGVAAGTLAQQSSIKVALTKVSGV